MNNEHTKITRLQLLPTFSGGGGGFGIARLCLGNTRLFMRHYRRQFSPQHRYDSVQQCLQLLIFSRGQRLRWLAAGYRIFARAAAWVTVLAAALLLPGVAAVEAEDIILSVSDVSWQQAAAEFTFRAFVEREKLSNLDHSSRLIFCVESGRSGPALEKLSVRWKMSGPSGLAVEGTNGIPQGLVDVSFDLTRLEYGRYEVTAELLDGETVLKQTNLFFRYVEEPLPPQSGKIALYLPRGVPAAAGTDFPVSGGIPFPKGALWDAEHVRVVTADGTPVPSQSIVRSRWGHRPQSSIRWLGIDFQSATAPKSRPGGDEARYYLEFGPDITGPAPQPVVRTRATPEGIEVDTGPLRFLVRRYPFTLLHNVVLDGRKIFAADGSHGLYLVDHEGSVYRAANDREATLEIEESGPLRTVLRAEGWYVKDGSSGATRSYTLPTDKLCKFITRIEAYAGQPYVRVLSTWVITYDSFSVRLRDLGFSLPVTNTTRALFGVEDKEPLEVPVPAEGVRLIQHLPHQFALESADGTTHAEGRHSAGWVCAESAYGMTTVSHRDTWQRFPKELEVLPREMRLHIWPAHGREHPEIDALAPEEIHKLWFAHQGRELNLAQPWDTYFAVAKLYDAPDKGVYKGPGLALAGVHSSAMGAAITSDFLIHFAPKLPEAVPADTAACFQAAPHVLADPDWACASLAAGYLHPYDPENMPVLEETIEDMVKGYWEIQDTAGEYGMWLYRVWHHNRYLGDGKWQLYRLYNATHHYEAFMPWMLYLRSGDPFYLTQGRANIRQLTDVQVLHYADADYPHHELHFRQKRLVGSTKHTNGFNTWGGDHMVFGHGTCYNAMMLAYYLTGDLRLREVVIDEWQNTILHDRTNPEFSAADRSRRRNLNGARDNTNSLGELLDLYQLTYEPGILAYVSEMLDIFLNNHMRHWGQPLHNVLLFHGSTQAQEQLLAAVEEHKATSGRPKNDPKTVWYTHSPHENFAMAAIIAPEKGYHVDAYFAAEPGRFRSKARRVRDQEPECCPFCEIPDYVLYLPRVMYAVALAGGGVDMAELSPSQAFPGCDIKLRGWTRCIVRNDSGRPFDLRLHGAIAEGGVQIRAYGPDNQELLTAVVPPGEHSPQVMTIPAPGVPGQYTVFLQVRDVKDKLRVPLTDLPEVYHLGYWSQESPTHFFTRSPDNEPFTIQVQPSKGKGQIYGPAGRGALALTESGEMMKAEIGPDGGWIATQSRYVVLDEPVTVSVSPNRWFAPNPDKLELVPW